MGTWLADATHGEEPHWKLSQISTEYDTADVTDDDNFLWGRCAGVFGMHLLVTRDFWHLWCPYGYVPGGSGPHHSGQSLVDPTAEGNNTVQYTMQCGICTVLHPNLSCQGISVPMTGCCTRWGCHVASSVTSCYTWISHQSTAAQWYRSLWQIFGRAEATSCPAKESPWCSWS
jgi:hypothetical protein